VQKGIMLHRMIDTFTDGHAATKEAKEILKPFADRYAGAFVDVVYDHFLAVDENEFPLNKLEYFANETYHALKNNEDILPEKFRNVLPYMINQNWLLNYRFEWGIENSFNGIFKRAKYLEKNNLVFKCFIKNYEALQKCYYEFFPAVKSFAFSELNLLKEQ
jgi:acyl carrier protein phosphodiesterase